MDMKEKLFIYLIFKQLSFCDLHVKLVVETKTTYFLTYVGSSWGGSRQNIGF